MKTVKLGKETADTWLVRPLDTFFLVLCGVRIHPPGHGNMMMVFFHDDFVSVFHHSLPDQIRIHMHLSDIGRIIPDYRCNSFTPMVSFMDLAQLLASGIPKLEKADFLRRAVGTFQ